MALITSAQIQEACKISHVAVSKGLKGVAYTLKKVDGSDRPVRVYEVEALPLRWRERIQIWREQNNATQIVPTIEDRRDGETKKSDRGRERLTRQQKDKYLCATKEEQMEALRKAKICEEYIKRPKGMTMQEFAKNHNGLPSRGQFFRWVQIYLAAQKSGMVLDALIDTRGRPRGSSKLSEEMKEMCERYMLRMDIHIGENYTAIYKNLKAAFGEVLPSYETVARYCKVWKKQNNIQWDFRKNPDKAKSRHLAGAGSASEKAKHKNHYWELDSTVADVITADGKRWTVVGAIDIHTRRVAVTLEESGGAYALCRNLRSAILKLGVPEHVVTDNGKDYTSNHFESVCINLHIEQIKVPPYSGDAKPHIERFFGTMSEELFRGIEGFCGHNVAQREGIRSTLSFEDRLKAVERWRAKNYGAKDFAKFFRKRKELAGMAIEVPLTSEELRGLIGDWVEYVYEHREHRGIKTTPLEKYKSDYMPAKIVHNQRSLDLLLGGFAYYTVGKNGVTIRKDGQTYQYSADELAGKSGQVVKVMFPDELSCIYVYDESGFVCEAIDPSVRGESRERLASVKKASKKLLKKFNKIQQEATTLAKESKDPTIIDIVAAAKEAHSGEVDSRVSAKVVAKTALDVRQKEEPREKRGVKKYFKRPFELFVYLLESGIEPDEEQKKQIKEQPEAYAAAKEAVMGGAKTA